MFVTMCLRSLRLKWRPGFKKRTIKELSQFDNKKPEELESEFDHSDLDTGIQVRLSKGVTSWV